MLRELPSRNHEAGENRRRWFFSHEIDLVVWLDDDDTPVGFQLAYDKYRNEHSLTWTQERGFRHYVVDEGNPLAGEAETPLLYANGSFDAAAILERFLALSAEVPPQISVFVQDKLSTCLQPPRPLE